MMASTDTHPLYIASTLTQNAVATTDCQITVSGHVEGDFLYAQITFAADDPITASAGWTRLDLSTQVGYDCRTEVYGKYASDSEPANYTWTSTSVENVGVMITFRYVAEVYPMDDMEKDKGADASPDMEALTAEFDGGLVIAAFGAEGNGVADNNGGPAGYTDVYSKPSGGASPCLTSVSYKEVDKGAVAATTGALTGAADWHAYHFILRGARTCEQDSTDFYWDLTNETSADSLWDGTYEQQPSQIVVHTIPFQPSEWADAMNEDIPQQVNVNIERLIQEADSTLTTRSYVSYLGGTGPFNPIVHDDTAAVANPAYQDAELYDDDHTDSKLRPAPMFASFIAIGGHDIRYYVTRIVANFTADAATDDIEIFHACTSTRFAVDDPSTPINTDIEQCHRGAGNTKLYGPDYFVSAWHVKRVLLKSINAMLAEMRPCGSVPLFGTYTFQGPA